LISEFVSPALADGAWVLSDRTAYSSLAYQSGGRGLPLDEIWTLNDIALGGVWPDAVVLLRLEPGTGLGRQLDADRIGNEGVDFHRKVAAAFDRLAASEPNRFVVVDASLPVDDVVGNVIDGLGLVK
jgi:dTMP kinase